MKIYLILLIQFFVVNSLLAFDYQAVYSNRSALFENSTNTIVGLKIDSVKFDRDSILFPFKNIQMRDNNCLISDGASWLGDKIVINQKWNYFFNENNDTIKIKIDAKLDETWTVYENGDTYIWATVSRIELISFLGLTDSVKTIVFSGGITTAQEALDFNSKVKQDDFDGNTILLSKHYGFLSMFSFLVFPHQDNLVDYFTGTWKQFNLVGLTNPTIGIQNLTWFDVYDFHQGDEIHTEYNYLHTKTGPATRITKNSIQKILKRQDFIDSITYQIEKISEEIYIYDGISTANKYSKCIVKSVIRKDSLFDLFLNEPYISGTELYQNFMYRDSLQKKNRSNPILFNQRLGCWSTETDYIDGPCSYGSSFYAKGLGGPYYKFESGCWPIEIVKEENSLVYYKKESIPHGIPLVIKRPDYFSKNMFWTEHITSMFSCASQSTSVYFVENDTLINGKTYKKILSRQYSGINPVYHYLGAIREDDGKVFGKFDFYNYQYGDAFEVEMYDFNLQVGDTVRTNLGENDTWWSHIKPIITSIDTITLLNGTERKRFLLSSGEIWIEGIGSSSGFLTPYFPMTTCGINYQLMCFVYGNEELYHNDAIYYYGACGKLSGVEEVALHDSRISLSPNPVFDWLTINTESDASEFRLELYDVQGKVVLKKQMNSFQNSVNLTNLVNGFYAYRLIGENKLLKTGRIIKL